MRALFKKIAVVTVAFSMAVSGLMITRNDSIGVQAQDGWNLVWSDEFNGDRLDEENNWNIEVNGNGGGNNEHQYYRRENVSVSDGTLKLTAKKESYGGKQYTSGRITTQNKQYFKYGRIESKLRMPSFTGAWPAFWMLGQSISKVGWPKCGEIDIMEAINTEDKTYSTVHWDYQNNHAEAGNAGPSGLNRTDWHVYAVEWDENVFKFYVDDTLIRTQGISNEAEMQEFRQEHFILFNFAIGGNWPGHTIDDSVFANGKTQTLEVDYVRVYQKAEEPTTPYDGPTVTVEHDAVAESNVLWESWFAGTGWQQSKGTVTSNGSTADKGALVDITDVGVDVGNDSQWGAQAKLLNLNFHPGNTYTYKCTLLSTEDKKIHVKVADQNEVPLQEQQIELKANVPYNYVAAVDIPSDFGDNTVSLKFGMGKFAGDTIADHAALQIRISDVSFYTVATIPDPSYVPQTTSKPIVETTTNNQGIVDKESTTKNVDSTTPRGVAVTTTAAKAKLGKVKIRRALRNKNNKKIKLTFKKVKGADLYQIKYATNKKLKKAKKKNTYYLKNTLRKLKAKKKYFIRVRAVRFNDDGTTSYGPWSRIKKVKVRKTKKS